MASKSGLNPTTIELTEVEAKLRHLLLDVAAFVDETSVPKTAEAGVVVPDELSKEKVVLRFTGGWVRDKLLGVDSHDIDVAINKMTGYQFGMKLKDYLEIPGNPAKYGLELPEEENSKSGGKDKSRRVAPGLYKIEANPEKSKHLETVTTKIMGLDIDLVNLRKETYTEESRNPQMEFGTPEEDAMRRDATVNAMFYNLNTSEIEDFTGRGFEDMDGKIIRTPLEPYQTFKDDPLRVLRLIRFASRLNYKIDPEAEKAMGNPDIKDALRAKISRERVGIETEKMLKGPDPQMALALIDRLDLYNTIFIDPTRPNNHPPDLEYLSPAYKFVECYLRTAKPDIPQIIPKTLIRNEEEQYFAWIWATLMPWVDAPMVPHSKPTQRPFYAATLVAREGIKAPNKICDVVTACLRDGEDIRKLVDACYTQLRRPNAKAAGEDPTARDTLGMAIRRWGPTWRSQLLFSLIYEIVLGSISQEQIFNSYSTFLNQLSKYGILEAYTFKPLITGTELAKALNTKPGPWMRDALDIVMAWQLRNPDIADPTEAIEAVKENRTAAMAGKQSELPSRLASHFLQLTIRPLFSQSNSKPHPNLTPAGRAAPSHPDQKAQFPDDTSKAPWKDPKNGYAIDLLRWTLLILGQKGIEANWGLLVPPILKMTDNLDIKWKSRGCEFLTLLLASTSPSLLSRTGLGNVFEITLIPLFTYLPTLTEEKESVLLLDKAFPALMELAEVMYPPPSHSSTTPQPINTLSTPREKFLDKLLRLCILAPVSHASPSTYPRLATSLLSHLPTLINAMQIDAVKHLQSLLPLLSSILTEPLGLAHPPLIVGSVKGLQAVVLNCWPRVGRYRGEIMKGVCVCWVRCGEEEGEEKKKEIEEVRWELKECVGMLDAVCQADDDLKGIWEAEKAVLVARDERLGGLFEGNEVS
ncbi:poly A polymerase C-terminal region-like protein [Lindgomyces ingoldianus]|uniref:Poly A polymerase C-terminal region-like protein n=1 Tax=Lindgomyces ingoldianus TaxID=673940 RepID=A0ACB6R531_9PLEO|nr:poly A polymerase C-terminal region-like protein [Lindgomyces ingoldianus]KAF2473948.1 poly A polymerase C-terminal region-like protein [Lindgomyces ingoldianus]